MKRKDKGIGAKVEVREIILKINPQVKWRILKKVKGVIVENKNYEYYCHTCNGDYSEVTKHIITSSEPTFAVKLYDNIRDLEGNNIIIVAEHNIKFLDRIEIKIKPVTEKAYLRAKKIIERYEKDNKIL